MKVNFYNLKVKNVMGWGIYLVDKYVRRYKIVRRCNCNV